MGSRSLVKALLECRCPHCREGKVFAFPFWNLRKFHEMPRQCPHCSADLIPEPGFYFGALYVSYAFTVALMVATWLFLYVLVKPGETVYILSLIISAILLMPLSFRYSRMIWLYWFG